MSTGPETDQDTGRAPVRAPVQAPEREPERVRRGGVRLPPVTAGAAGTYWALLLVLHALSLVLVVRTWWARRVVNRGRCTARARRHGP